MPKTEEKRTERPKKKSGKRKKNESLELLRAVTKSMAGAIPGISEETNDLVDDSLARVGSGLTSQLMGYNEETGNVDNAALANLRRIWNADDRRRRGLPKEKRVLPGIVTDTLSLPNMLGNGPEWSQRMQSLADATHEGVREGMNLEPAQGLRQNALESGGMMLGQLPIPSGQKAKAAKQLGGGALNFLKHYGKKAAMSPIEFFSPTVDPKVSNYVSGAVAGGALGSLGDEIPEEEFPIPRIAKAKGGKVGALMQFLKAVNLSPDAAEVPHVGYQIGDPVEEVLYATNEGQRKGVLSGDEAKRIKLLLESGEDEELSEALLDLHARLNPKASPKPTLQVLPEDLVAKPYSGAFREPVHGKGKLTQEQWDQRQKKSKGGMIQKAFRFGSKNAKPQHRYNPRELGRQLARQGMRADDVDGFIREYTPGGSYGKFVRQGYDETPTGPEPKWAKNQE